MFQLRSLVVGVGLALATGCHHDDFYEPCRSADECGDVPSDDPACIDGGGDGICTWACKSNDDCDADDRYQGFVCASFESTEDKYCFPSCDGASDADEEQDMCGRYLECRSTGGGSDNEKVCYPTEG